MEILKQPISKPHSCDNSDSQVISKCDLTQGDQSFLEALPSQVQVGNLGNLGNLFSKFLKSDFLILAIGRNRKLGIIIPRFSKFPRCLSFLFVILPFSKKIFFTVLK